MEPSREVRNIRDIREGKWLVTGKVGQLARRESTLEWREGRQRMKDERRVRIESSVGKWIIEAARAL